MAGARYETKLIYSDPVGMNMEIQNEQRIIHYNSSGRCGQNQICNIQRRLPNWYRCHTSINRESIEQQESTQILTA